MSGGYPRRRTKRAAPEASCVSPASRACSPVPADPRSCFLRLRRQGRALHRRDLHPGQRAPGRGGAESPGAGRPADDLLQGRQPPMAPPGKNGVAHFLEHLMFKGTPSVADGRVLPARSPAMRRRGQCLHQRQDYTAFHQPSPRDHLPLIMGLEADRMTDLVLTDGQVVLRARRSSSRSAASGLDNDPGRSSAR